MLTAANTRKSSRIPEKIENKRMKIDDNVRNTITRTKSNEKMVKVQEIPRRSPRQSLSGKEDVYEANGKLLSQSKASYKAQVKSKSQVKSKAASDSQFKESSDLQSKMPTDSQSKKIKNSQSKTPTDTQPISEDPFHVAKRAFHRSGNFKIIGRVEEKAELTRFWYDHVESGRGGSIYISGNPGTGKTALVDELIPELMLMGNNNYKLIKINCMMLKDPLKAFKEISQSIKSLKVEDKNPFLILNALEGYFCNEAKEMVIIIIDEIDQIGIKEPELLCKLLAMPYLPNCKVCIFGIANSIDLTERFLPRLKFLNCEPVVLHFPQYTVPDITSILCDRLERINSGLERINSASLIESKTFTSGSGTAYTFIDKPAIELTARKVASTGDLRRALDILRQAIDLAEDEYKLSNRSKDKGRDSLVKLNHVVKIMEKFGSSQSGPLVLLKSLNLHQKVILSAIVGFPQEKGSILTIQKLYEEYSSAAIRPPKLYDSVTRSEFIDLIYNLESMSLIGKSIESSITDLWKLKVYLLVPNELIKTMISHELPTIKALFGL